MLNRAASAALAIVFVFLAASASPAKDPAAYTTIEVKDMHCLSCAKKIAGKLYDVAGVAEVRADVKTNRAYVIPKGAATLPPVAIWEAVQKAGFQPIKLTGPAGTFTTKPRTR